MNNDLFYKVSVMAGTVSHDLSHDIASLTVEENGSGPVQLTVEAPDPYKVNSHALQEGMEIETDLGVVSDHAVIFKGRIAKTEGSFPRNEIPRVRILAYDRGMNMGLRKKNKIWTDTSLTEIVITIAKHYFDESDIKIELMGDPVFKGNGIRQQDETDLAFLLRLGYANGCEMFVVYNNEKTELHFESQYSIM